MATNASYLFVDDNQKKDGSTSKFQLRYDIDKGLAFVNEQCPVYDRPLMSDSLLFVTHVGLSII